MTHASPPLKRLPAALRRALHWLAAVFGLICLSAPAPALAREVSVGAFVTSISDIDPAAGTFRIAFYAWFNDPAGRFDPERDLYVIARSVTFSEIETEPAPGGGTYTIARIEAFVDQEFDFGKFPFDEQRLTLRIEAADDEYELSFAPDTDSTRISEYLSLLGWTVDGVAIETDTHAYDTDFGYWVGEDKELSQILLSVDISRIRSPVLIDDFLGFTFAFIITALTFVVPCTELGLRVGMSTGSLFAAVVNLNRLDTDVGFKPDFGLVDRLAFLIFGTIVTALLISLTTNRMSKRRNPEDANKIDTAAGMVALFIYLSLIVWTVREAMA